MRFPGYILLLLWVSLSVGWGAPAYSVRDVPSPDGAVIEAGGVYYWPDGSLVVATRRGDIWVQHNGRWIRFAVGLMDPLGIWANTAGEVYVMQSAELTRICDTNSDGVADRYETVTAGWGIPGSRTDFVYGLCRDTHGNFYGTMHTTHQPWAGGAKISPYSFGGPMGAAMIGRGWSFQVSPQGKLTWWSSGLRAPNGLAFNAAGDLFATDNQGDWVGTSAMHHIVQGDFHGHPSSYQWDPLRTLDLKLPLDKLALELDKLRKRPAVLFPHGILGNSPSQPVLAPADGRFGPFAGQFFVGDNVAPLISRVYLEKIDGAYQGACFPFIREQGLKKALCRMAFSPEGKLTIAFGCRGWGPGTEGLQEVVWSGETPFEMQEIRLLTDGFEVHFTKPLAELDLSKAVAIESFYYKYHHTYGSPIMDRKPLECLGASLSNDRRVLKLRTSALETGRIYEFKLKGVSASDGSALLNNEGYYTLNRLRPVESSKWTFFPLCMDTQDAKKRSLEEQAQLFAELGYEGCGHLCQDLGYTRMGAPNTTVEQRAKTLSDQGLRLVHTYAMVFLERQTPVDLKRIEEMMPTLSVQGSQLILRLMGSRTADLDGKAVELLGKIADLAETHGVVVAIYPHVKDYTETVGEALRMVRKLDRPKRLGVMFNLSHWQNCDSNRDLRAVLTDAAPYLKAVSINGSNEGKPGVLPLSQGDFDVGKVLGILQDIGFHGPVGLMCWGIGGDAREHLTSSMAKWQELTSPVQLQKQEDSCGFETRDLKGKIGDGRFIGLNQLVYKPTGTKLSGDGKANRHGLLTLYRVFTRNHRYGSAAYDWSERQLSVSENKIFLRWPATEARPFELEARYSFPKRNEVQLQVSVKARAELVDFEVQVGSYFDDGFPKAGVWLEGLLPVSAPASLGTWQAFPRDQSAIAIIGDGRWKQGPSPVEFAMRPPFAIPASLRRNDKLAALLHVKANDCFAIYAACDGEYHFSNYHALFGRTIPAGSSASASISLSVGEWTEAQILDSLKSAGVSSR